MISFQIHGLPEQPAAGTIPVQNTSEGGGREQGKPVNISIRAVYEEGRLRPLDPLDPEEGQEVRLLILKGEKEPVREALGEMVVPPSHVEEEALDEEALLREIEEACRGGPPASDAILQERRDGP